MNGAAIIPTGKPLWRHRDFMLLWGGQTVNLFGSQVSWLAVPMVAMVTLHATKFQVAALGAVEALPALLASLPAGVVVDRHRRKPLMMGCAVGSAAAMGSIPLAAAVGHITLVQLYAVALIVGVLGVLFDSAAASLPLLLLGGDRLVDASGKMNTARGLAEMAGPSVGGFLVGLVGAARAVSADALSYVVSAVTLASMRYREPPPTPKAPHTRFRTEIADGLRFILGHRLLRPLVLSGAVVSFLLSGISSIWLLYVITELHWSVRAAGLVYGLSLAGGVVGSLLAKRVIDRIGMSKALIAGALLSAPLEAVTPLVSRGLAGQWIVAVVFTALTAAGMVNVTASSAARQLLCPPEMLGRMNGSSRFLGQGLRPLGPLVAGGLGTLIGLRPTLFLLAGSTLLGPLILLMSSVRTTREVPVHKAYA